MTIESDTKQGLEELDVYDTNSDSFRGLFLREAAKRMVLLNEVKVLSTRIKRIHNELSPIQWLANPQLHLTRT